MKNATFCWIALLLVCRPLLAAPRVTASLVADVSTVQAGHPFTLGVVLQIQPGWHVYWTNPGDSGAPTTVALKLPPGFSTGPILFPVPDQFDQPGNIVGYGYMNQVLLKTTVTPPQELKSGTEIPLTADIAWLCCHDVCIPGNAVAKLSLTAADKAAPANGDLFAKWAASFPVAAIESPWVKVCTIRVDGVTHLVSIRVYWKQPVSQVRFVPGANDALSIKDISLRTENGQSNLTFRLDLLQGQTLKENQLESLVAFTDDSGTRRGLQTDISLQALRTDKKNP